jgi:eukaryotic-like serine/threonine-protein kinase
MTSVGEGRYELDGLLGHGGMAEVRMATDVRLGRTVAIKRLRTDLARDPTFQARFRREAQSAASLNHPSIVAVYDTGEEVSTDGSGVKLPYIVMEYVEGRTLRDILRDGRKLLPERALEITRSVLTALDYSHRAGIIHRDIKPANVMLTPTGDVKVMDFGIARAVADASSTMTQTAAVIGTAQYLSPEQARGEQVDARSDIYSTGCLLYELLTGRPPFVGDSPISVAYQHVREEAPPPSTLDPEISPEIDAITLKALAKSVDERYQSALEMSTDIDRALDGKEVLAPPVVGATELETQHFLAQPPLEPAPTRINPALIEVPDEEPRRRRGGALWAGALLLLAALVVGGLFVVPQLFADESPPLVSVPAVKGLTVARAEKKLDEAGLELRVSSRIVSTSETPGHILRQSEEPGTLVDEGTAINVTVAARPDDVTIPSDITDMDVDEATATLKALTLTVITRPVKESTEAEDEVTSTDPPPGSVVQRGTPVTVLYSAGLVTVPSVIDMTLEQAKASLRAEGFDPEVDRVTADEPQGVVVDQDPSGGSRQPAGTTVTITVSTGPPPEPTTSSPPTETTTPAPTTSAPTTTQTPPATSTSPTTTPPPTSKPTKPPKPTKSPKPRTREDTHP